MVGLSQWQLMTTDTDTLLRAAQAGDKDALVQLRERGEMNDVPGITPPSRSRQFNDRIPVLGLERPAYLDRGISRDMARPAGMTKAPLPFMSAINQQPATPPYLGMNLGQEPAGPPAADDPIARIAAGHDAAAPIQAGAAAADQDVSAMTPERPTAGISALQQPGSEDPEGYGGMIGSLIRDIQAGINPEKNRANALAEAGFAMAASGSPYFFQGVGAGGLAGLKAFRESQERDMEARVRAATLAGKELERGEVKRSNKVQEGLEQERNTETTTHNRATEAEAATRAKEDARHNRMLEQNAAYDSSLRARGLDQQAEQLQFAKDQFERTQALAEKGFATEEQVKKAQIDLTKAQTEAQKSLGLSRDTEVQVGQDGTVYKLDLNTNKAEPFLDNKGQPIKGQPKQQTATSQKIQYWTQAGKDPQWIADVLAGKRQPTQKEAMTAASFIANNAAANIMNPNEASAVYNQTYQQALTELTSGGGTPSSEGPSAEAPGSQAAPLYKTPEDVKGAYKRGEITKEQATDQIRKLQGQ